MGSYMLKKEGEAGPAFLHHVLGDFSSNCLMEEDYQGLQHKDST